jgi:hypothetical protein
MVVALWALAVAMGAVAVAASGGSAAQSNQAGAYGSDGTSAGRAAAPGVTGLLVVTKSASAGAAIARCPAGKRVVGGGGSSATTLQISHPVDGTWVARARGGAVQARAICADVVP